MTASHPAEPFELRAKLRRCHQVSQLSMAADNHRNSGQPGRRNHSEIGVKIECMRYLHSVAPQMTTQKPASAQRFPAIQTPAHIEFGNVRETIGERPFTQKAASMKLKSVGVEILCKKNKLALGSSGLEAVGHQEETGTRVIGNGSFGSVHGGRFHQIILPPERWPAWKLKQ